MTAAGDCTTHPQRDMKANEALHHPCPASVPTTVEDSPAATRLNQRPLPQHGLTTVAASDKPHQIGNTGMTRKVERRRSCSHHPRLTKPAIVMAIATSHLVAENVVDANRHVNAE